MLGNFSFGNYFKKEAISWAWEFTTEVLKLPKDRLYATIYLDDDEAYDIWVKDTDIDSSRIFRLGKEDNFWEHGAGPCGPCSEIHYDRGEGKIETVEEFVKAGDNDRVLEFWNLVFTQFDRDEQGNYNRLPRPNIDTGMGLERMAVIMQDKDNIFEIDTINAILKEISAMSSSPYGIDRKSDISMRVITDHIRSIVFMISDGILPSNEGRGYVLRRLLRRAAKHGRSLGIEGAFLYRLSKSVIDNSYEGYPELREREDYIKKIIKIEEEKFAATIDGGIQILDDFILQLRKSGNSVLDGGSTFKLYDTYGFPVELTEEILEENNMTADLEGFKENMENQRNMARSARAETNYMGVKDTILNKIPMEVNTIFEGYDRLKSNSKVKVIMKDEEFVSRLSEGEEGVVVVENTPFYAEMGGQVGDSGTIYNDTFRGEVLDCKNNVAGKILHFVKISSGSLNLDDDIVLSVDKGRRDNIGKNHTATHILDETLKRILGEQVHQAGSYVDEHRLRFDFNYFEPLSYDTLRKIENMVNDSIMAVYPVKTVVMPLEEAKKSGAIALFDSKYKDKVRVVSVGDFSRELCGGTHVSNSGKIGLFKIISETGIAAGIRRIEAVTGKGAIDYVDSKDDMLKKISGKLKCSEKEIIHKLDLQFNELKSAEREIQQLKLKLAGNAENDILNRAKTIDGIKLFTGVLKEVDASALRELGDKFRSRYDNCLVVLGSSVNGKVQLIAMATEKAVQSGINCGKIIKEIAAVTGGNGGGRPDMAQAGGKLPEKLEEAVERCSIIVEKRSR